jgi:hypothetical protein
MDLWEKSIRNSLGQVGQLWLPSLLGEIVVQTESYVEPAAGIEPAAF